VSRALATGGQREYMVAPVQSSMSAEQIREANVRYHDVASESYDAKWGIDFGDVGHDQVVSKLRKAIGNQPLWYRRALEIGAGTGYFTLNMLRAGLIEQATCTDISAGMLATLSENAGRLGVSVRTVQADAEKLPLEDASFELVFGHAVLHHIPDLARAFNEFARVLAPGGTLLFAGEPSRWGDRLARIPKRTAGVLAPAWRRAIGAGQAPPAEGTPHDHGLEGLVDVHSFAPVELQALACEAGLESVRVNGEELLANWFGWTNRTLEASADPSSIPWAWRRYAFEGYLFLQEVDRRLLESRLPPAIFYNLMLCARKPTHGGP
jgi:SAM-dependent methyltransferase